MPVTYLRQNVGLLLFIVFALLICWQSGDMFDDTDPLWHVAAGDWIRAHHALPRTDPWSYTAGDYRWYDLSWAWDVLASIARQHLGWHGLIAINALTIALTLALAYVLCLERSGNAVASLLSAAGVYSLISPHLRPLQVTDLMIVIWLIILSRVTRGQWGRCWLLALPASMLFWANMHGGIVVAPMLIGFYFLGACTDKNFVLACNLAIAGILCALAALCTPYGWHIVEAILRPIGGPAEKFIIEWEPINLSAYNLEHYWYVWVFIILTLNRRLPVLWCERWMAYLCLGMAALSIRNLAIFGIVASPLAACGIERWLRKFRGFPHPRCPVFVKSRLLMLILIGISIGFCIMLPTRQAAILYRQESIDLPTLEPEIAYIEKHYPKARLLTHFNLAGVLLYETRGHIPVFIDPRTETAQPADVTNDYRKFIEAEDDWEDMFDNYHIDGLLLPNEDDDVMLDRFQDRRGFKVVYTGPTASLIMRTP